jgi:hypothetical protein
LKSEIHIPKSEVKGGLIVKRVSLLLGVVIGLSLLAVLLYAQMRDVRSRAVKQAVAAIQKDKQKLIDAGTYDCCLKHPCNQCMVNMGACPCGARAENNQPVCHECKGGWYAGDGNIPGKTADQIKTMPRK